MTFLHIVQQSFAFFLNSDLNFGGGILHFESKSGLLTVGTESFGFVTDRSHRLRGVAAPVCHKAVSGVLLYIVRS